MSGARLRDLTPEKIEHMTRPELVDVRRELTDTIGRIREDMRERRASILESGDNPDRDPWYRRAAHAARMFGRLVSRVDVRLRELAAERVALRQLAAELLGEPAPSHFNYAAGVLESAATHSEDERIAGDLVRVAAWLRREADARRAIEDATG